MRKYLTPRETRDMMERQHRRCAVCDGPIGKWFDLPDIPFVREHWNPVANGNDQKPDCLLCEPCAHRKTYGTKATTYGSDAHEIAKAKRIAAGGRKRKGRKLQSRPFDKSLTRKFSGEVVRRG